MLQNEFGHGDLEPQLGQGGGLMSRLSGGDTWQSALFYAQTVHVG